MTISTLIAELQKLQALHGDLPVTIPFGVHAVEEFDRQLADVTLNDSEYSPDYKSDDVHAPHVHLS